ncbi:hypothetical protein ACEZ3G_14335 [Maribacter algicola]|uniref:Uncharacterized protein n=1 Tax=Meishania litoralis TaxID=3434685 RepID=A0ACC7LLI7_9FLAO
MDDKAKFVYENLEKKSNAISGFVILQSLALAYQFSKADFILKIKEINFVNYIIIGRVILLVFAIISIILINKKMNRNIGNLKDEVFSTQSNLVKICLILFFGVIPIYVLFHS